MPLSVEFTITFALVFGAVPVLTHFSAFCNHSSFLGRYFKTLSLVRIFPSKFILTGNIYVQNVSFFTILSLL